MTSDRILLVLLRDFLAWKRGMKGHGIRLIAAGVAFILLVAFVAVVAALKQHGG